MSRAIYRYRWGNNEKRLLLRGRECVINAAGAKRSVLITFLDNGQREVVSMRALERIDWRQVPFQMRFMFRNE